MKKILIFVILILVSCKSYSQTSSNLLDGETITNDLLFDGKCIGDIDATGGDNSNMVNLFGSSLTREDLSTETGNLVIYSKNGIKFVFKENGDTESVFSLTSIEVYDATPVVKLQNKLISVNNSIDVLPNTLKSTYNDEHYILYTVENVDVSLMINYNYSTKKITSIVYNNQLDY